MSEHIRLKKGLDLPISGEALCKVTKSVVPDVVSLKPTDFKGLVPRLLVKEGDPVKAGTPIFADKQHPEVLFCSPVAGTVQSVVRGDKRKLLEIRIKAQAENDYVEFDVPKAGSMNRENVAKALLESGLWPCIKQRPYGIVADPQATPKAVFISAMNTAPLSANLDFTMEGELENLQAGINALKCLTPGDVHISLNAKSSAGDEFHKLKNVICHSFDGPHPAGNVGVQINHISPINKGEVVWTVDLFLVAAIGRLFNTGRLDMSRTIAVAGPAAVNPSYVKCTYGICMSQISEYFSTDKGDVRVISGDVLTGESVGADGFLGFYEDQVSVLAEGKYFEMFGWAKPFRFKKFSVSRAYPAFLFCKKKYDMDTNENGGQRPFLINDVYQKVLPMDIYALPLFKAILAGDIEKMENLGIYEIVEEDVALCEYVCPSKVDIQKIVSDGIALMMKEMA